MKISIKHLAVFLPCILSSIALAQEAGMGMGFGMGGGLGGGLYSAGLANYQYMADLQFPDQQSCDAAYAGIAESKIFTVMPRKTYWNSLPAGLAASFQDSECFNTGSYYGLRIWTPYIANSDLSDLLSKDDCASVVKTLKAYGKNVQFFNTSYMGPFSMQPAPTQAQLDPPGTITRANLALDNASCFSLDDKHSELHIESVATQVHTSSELIERNPANAGSNPIPVTGSVSVQTGTPAITPSAGLAPADE